MPRLQKNVDSASLTFEATLPDRREYGVLVAKRAYQIGYGGALVARPEQELLAFADEFYGDINTSSPFYPSDIVPYKQCTDVLLAANARAPGARPHHSWSCGVRVHGRLSLAATLRVYGPRVWHPGRRGSWSLTETEPVTQVPIRWEHAWGGQLPGPSDPEVICVREENPIGCGWIDREMRDHGSPVDAPQLEWTWDPISDPYAVQVPACFTPVHPAWLPRRSLGGTFDKAWMDTQRPFWPMDYEFGFHNAAPEPLRSNGHLDGDETIELINLVDGIPACGLSLPGTGLVACVGKAIVRLAFDTLFLDIRSPHIEDWMITTTWRMVIPPTEEREIVLEELLLSDPRYLDARLPLMPGDVARQIAATPELELSDDG